MHFDSPLWFLLFPGLLLLLWFSLPRNDKGKRRWPEGHVAWIIGFRFAALATLIITLAGPSLNLPSQRQDVFLLVDVSDSQGKTLIEQSRQSAIGLVSALREDDRVCLIAFAASASVLAGPASPVEILRQLDTIELSGPDPSQSDYGAAFQLAKRLADPSQGQPVWWLFGDGQASKGGSLTDLGPQLGNARLFTLPQGRPAQDLASLALEVPAILRAGEQAQVVWRVVSPSTREQKIKLLVDGETVSASSVWLAEGENRIELTVPPVPAGTHRLDLQCVNADGLGQSASMASAYLETDAPAQILLVSHSGANPPLAAILQSQGMRVSHINSQKLPASLSAYEGISTLILDNIPARDIDSQQQSALQAYVSSGGGLLVVGGDQSLGRGDYYATALEELLPVKTDSRQRLLYNRTRILFVIDHSGSMSENVNESANKLDAAVQGVLVSLDQLANKDEIAVMTFDSEPSWVLEFTPVEQRQKIKAALAQLPSGGGTDMAKAMEEVVASFGAPGPIHRHVVFLTDGETSNTTLSFQEMAEHLATQGVSVTTIGIGETIDADLLADVARWGNGTFYRAEGDQIPRIIKQDTVKLTRELIQEGSFAVVNAQAGDFGAELPEKLPPVSGYLLTTLKPEAALVLGIPATGDRPDPLWASWRYGSGQVAVFTADSGRRWLPAWSGSPALNQLWGGMVRGLESGKRDQGLHMHVQVQAATVRVSLDAIDSQRNLRNGLNLEAWMDGQAFALRETAPGHYEAALDISVGLHRFRAIDPASGDWTSAWVWNPSLAESSQSGTDLPGLSGLSKASGGELRPFTQPGLASRHIAWLPWPIFWPCLLIGLILLLIDLGMRSTLLGQLAMASAIIREWWRRQRDQANLSIGQTGPFQAETGKTDTHKVMDAYRYLALAKQEKLKAGESKKSAL